MKIIFVHFQGQLIRKNHLCPKGGSLGAADWIRSDLISIDSFCSMYWKFTVFKPFFRAEYIGEMISDWWSHHSTINCWIIEMVSSWTVQNNQIVPCVGSFGACRCWPTSVHCLRSFLGFPRLFPSIFSTPFYDWWQCQSLHDVIIHAN